ncbi:hypothetical protein F5884DRAFT_817060 [Xylogone sp. PMI_703]|nr:hypothetical protein F5884DRAFT_817060 [Xylogone sp. PMI_703]
MAKRSREDFEPRFEASDSFDDKTSISPKLLHLDLESGEELSQTSQMRCSLPPHRDMFSFTSYEDYEVHYNKFHVNRCVECHKNFPTNHFLNLHIEESHDPLILVRRERGDKTYSCYVEDCDRKFSAPAKRRMHLIDKHFFPKDYNFFVTVDGIDKQSSMLQLGRHRRRSSAAQYKAYRDDRAGRRSFPANSAKGSGAEAENNAEDHGEITNRSSANIKSKTLQEDEVMEDLSSAMSSLKVVPLSIRFGRSSAHGRGGFARK